MGMPTADKGEEEGVLSVDEWRELGFCQPLGSFLKLRLEFGTLPTLTSTA